MLKLENVKIKEVTGEKTFGSINQYRRIMVVFSFEIKNKKGETFEDTIAMNIWNERIDLFPLRVGEIVDVNYFAEVKTYNDNIYNNLTVYSITPKSDTPTNVKADFNKFLDNTELPF